MITERPLPPYAIDRVSDDIRDRATCSLVSDIVSWRRPPATWSGGRAGWEPVDLGEIRGLKFKGLGLRPYDGIPASPPAPVERDRWAGEPADRHLGITDDGEFCLRDSDPAPLGGLALTGALREQSCARALCAAGVPSARPIAAFRYRDMTFRHGERDIALGVSVTGGPSAHDQRLGDVWTMDLGSPAFAEVTAALGIDDAATSGVLRLRVLAAAYARLGTTLTQFSAAGWFRYSGHPGNIVIGPTGRAVLVDLDSCRARCDVTSDRFVLETVRDGMSALYNLSCTFYGEHRRLVQDEDLCAEEPFSAFIAAWDPDGDVAEARRDGLLVARYVVESRRRLERFAEFLDRPSDAGRQLYRFVRHDRDLTYALLFRLLYSRRLARPHVGEAPFDLDELDRRLQRFAGLERMERLEALA